MSHDNQLGERPKQKRRSRQKCRADERKVAELLALCVPDHVVCERLNLTPSQLQHHKTNLAEHFRRRQAENVDKFRGEQLAQLDHMIAEAYAAWERSQQPKTRRVVEGRRKAGSGDQQGEQLTTGKVTQTTEGQTGDPSYLFALSKLMERKARLVGADKPIELRHILEEREQVKSQLLEAIRRHVKDPATLRALAAELTSLGTEPESDTTPAREDRED